jgi:hypothetical protein
MSDDISITKKFINESIQQKVEENSFDAGVGGMAGSINTQPGYGTFSSPDVAQNPASFHSSDYNKYYDKHSTGQPDTQITDTSGSFDADVEKLFQKKQKPTPDDIFCGMEYEMGRMIHKDKRTAKEIVINNLKKHGPKYYTKLGMLNITEPDLSLNLNELNMMNINDKTMDVSPVMQERINVLNQMVAEKEAKRADLKLNDAIQDILREKREQRISRTNDLLKRTI